MLLYYSHSFFPISLHFYQVQEGINQSPARFPFAITFIHTAATRFKKFQSTMSTNFAGATPSKKRKMKEVINADTLHVSGPSTTIALPHQHANPPRRNESFVPTDLNLHVDDIGTSLARPVPSFTALLMGNDDDDEQDRNLQQQTEQIENIIEAHTDHMRSTLANLWRKNYHATLAAAEEIKAKKLDEKQKDLETMRQIVEYYRRQSDHWQVKAKALEQTVTSLKAALRNSLLDVSDAEQNRPRCVGCQGVPEEDDAESSFVDPGPASSKMKCITCMKKQATVLMWPCQHVAVCVSCEPRSPTCPLCGSQKSACYGVYLS